MKKFLWRAFAAVAVLGGAVVPHAAIGDERPFLQAEAVAACGGPVEACSLGLRKQSVEKSFFRIDLAVSKEANTGYTGVWISLAPPVLWPGQAPSALAMVGAEGESQMEGQRMSVRPVDAAHAYASAACAPCAV